MQKKQPRLLVIWGKYDLSFDLSEPERYRKDVPNAQVHVLDGGHFALDRIAGMPVVAGFYTLLLPLLAFAVFGSSRYLVVAADSATASILTGKLATMAPIASARYVALASTVALLTAGFLLLARILKLGFLTNFLSQTVLTGFLTGVGFQVGIAVLGEMVGLEVHSNRTVGQLVDMFRSLPRIHLPTVAISAVVVTGVFAFSRFAPKVPGSLLAVAGAIGASSTWDFAGHGIAIIGPVVGGLPHLGLPDMHWKDVVPLLGVSVSCFVMVLAQSAATARFYAVRHHQHLDESVDLVGLSAANAAAALSGTFVVDGSPTQTAMVESSGGESQLAQVAAAIAVAFVLLFVTKPLENLCGCPSSKHNRAPMRWPQRSCPPGQACGLFWTIVVSKLRRAVPTFPSARITRAH